MYVLLVVLNDIVMSNLYQKHYYLINIPCTMIHVRIIGVFSISCISRCCCIFYPFWLEELFTVLCMYVLFVLIHYAEVTVPNQKKVLLWNLSNNYWIRYSVVRFDVWLFACIPQRQNQVCSSNAETKKWLEGNIMFLYTMRRLLHPTKRKFSIYFGCNCSLPLSSKITQ